MPSESTLVRLGALTAAVGAVSAGITLVAGLVLADSYRPHAPGAEVSLLPRQVRDSDRWSDWHLVASVVFVIAAIALLVVIWLLCRRQTGTRALLAMCAVGCSTAVVVLWTRPMVRWDQLALWAVTVGTNVSGYWYAAFDDGVRFVLIDGSEVSQGQYAPALIAHLVAPAMGLLILIGALGIFVRRTVRSRTDHLDGVGGEQRSVVP